MSGLNANANSNGNVNANDDDWNCFLTNIIKYGIMYTDEGNFIK